MKRISLLLLAALLLAACSASPKSKTSDFAKFLPGKIGDWEKNEQDTVELLNATVTSKGHITMVYEGPDDALAYLVIEAHPTNDAADVAVTARERELVMMGLELEKNRVPQQVTADVAQQGRVRYALLQDQTLVVEIDVLAGSEENPVSDEAFDDLLAIVRNAFEKVSDD
ncbi:MAG: hypothetical protein JW966_10995 [Anaerolineae bacterium]|nr:hypothetical protein [Anaerolineae bacterium]